MNKTSNGASRGQAESLLQHTITQIEEDDDDQSPGGYRDTSLVEERPVGVFHLLALTIPLGGLFVVWSVILSNGSSFLVSLGLSKSLTALVWIAAPLCGTLVQPVVGSVSDRSRSRWGRRRPFLMGGTIGITISIMALAWTKESVHASMWLFGANPESATSQNLVVLLATLWVYMLNISIQPFQSGIRALIVENCPADQQAEANTYASVISGIGNIFGYIFGFSDLPKLFSSSQTQFQCLALVASLSVVSTTSISCWLIKEKSSVRKQGPNNDSVGLLSILNELSITYKNMPHRIRKVLHIQFCAWMGWFPFLFYSTIYVAEFYDRSPLTTSDTPQVRSNVSPEPVGIHSITPEAIRYGSFASLLFSFVSLIVNILLPPFLKYISRTQNAPSRQSSQRIGIIRSWAYSHLLFAITMFATLFVNSPVGAITIVAVVGICRSLTIWAPFTLISRELAARQSLRNSLNALADEDGGTTTEARDVQTGAIMGLHNVALSAPQILSALICSIIYALARAMGSQNGTAWVLRAGGIGALVAAWSTMRFED